MIEGRILAVSLRSEAGAGTEAWAWLVAWAGIVAGAGTGVEAGGVASVASVWVAPGLLGEGEGGAAHDLRNLDEKFGLWAGLESPSSLFRRPSFRRASKRTLWGSFCTQSVAEETVGFG